MPVRLEPSPWPPLNLAIALARGVEYVEAEALLREALRLDPAAARARYHLGTVLEQTDRPDEAIASLRAAADADPAYAEPLYALARIYRRQRRIAEADAALAAFTTRRQGEKQAAAGAAARP